jgi:hypothetical protein
MSGKEQLLKRLQQLERENARLRKKTGDQTTTTREDEYKGHPVLNFDGPFRSFSLGLKKLRAVIACEDEVKAFLDKHAQTKASEVGESDLQI